VEIQVVLQADPDYFPPQPVEEPTEETEVEGEE